MNVESRRWRAEDHPPRSNGRQRDVPGGDGSIVGLTACSQSVEHYRFKPTISRSPRRGHNREVQRVPKNDTA